MKTEIIRCKSCGTRNRVDVDKRDYAICSSCRNLLLRSHNPINKEERCREYWSGKSDDELINAALSLEDYTPEGKEVIMWMLRERGLFHRYQLRSSEIAHNDTLRSKEQAKISNLENVKIHRKDICKALGIPFTEDMITDDFFIGRFYSDARSFLNAKGLINRGFCPLCGVGPIDGRFFRKANPVTEYLCAECYTRTNPETRYADDPGYFVRRIAVKGCMWVIGLGIILIIVKSCV